MEEIQLVFSIYILCLVKFIAGPLLGKIFDLPILLRMLITVAGMMTSVVLFVYAGDWIKRRIIYRFLKNRKKFTKRNRRFVRLWKSYGLLGVAFLTPLLLSPIPGTLLMSGVENSRNKVIRYMFFAACTWAVIITLAVEVGYEAIPASWIDSWSNKALVSHFDDINVHSSLH
ncbi:MAG: hypothetical protein LAT68_01935 [Cyclobacteriaceae bacterium]|nr:hypothetical protein [Cyclobacteriaceae bacterium]MCH8515063.1 hypothetical protein [Cyclobacteriaceae bacterium]